MTIEIQKTSDILCSKNIALALAVCVIIPFSELPDCWRLEREDLVGGHQRERHHVDQVLDKVLFSPPTTTSPYEEI